MDYRYLAEKLKDCGQIYYDEPMALHTTWCCGGPADLLVSASAPEQISSALKVFAEEGINPVITGGGSNLLVGDSGIRGAVLEIRDRERKGKISDISADGDEIHIYSDASVRKSFFMDYCNSRGFAGAVFMAGIPGCVGGGIFMNAGTSDGSFGGILETVFTADRNGAVHKIPAEKTDSGYRKFSLEAGSVITGAVFRLMKGDPVFLKKQAAEILSQRKIKHPLEYPSAGSVFKNPEGHFAWKLVNDAGLRGKSIGQAQVSEKHTNFIVNKGKASSSDVLSLIRLVQKTVLEKTGIQLEPEVKFMGDFDR